MTILTTLMGFLLFSGGPAAMTAHAQAPVGPSYTVALTAYNAVPEQTDGNPFETASGAYSNPEVVAARSQDLASELPFGTIIELDGSTISSDGTCGFGVVAPRIGYRVIEDTMNARYTNRVDILLDGKASYATTDKGMKNAAQILGICKGVTVRVVGYVDVNHIPKTQDALAAIVGAPVKTLALK
jgi:3D (Asp-Asp-Asp) domain-containing protein